MFTILNFSPLLREWSDFFENSSPSPQSQPTNINPLIFTPTLNATLYFYDLIFLDFQNPSPGGAISINTANNKTVLIESSLFCRCSCTGSGGSIYFNSVGTIVLNRICCSKSQASGYGLFCSFWVSNLINYLIILQMTTVFQSESSSDSQQTITIVYGRQIINSLNSSYNIVTYYSGFRSDSCNISFSINSNNIAINYGIVALDSYSNFYKSHFYFFNLINNSNILQNRIIYFAVNAFLQHCIFKMNSLFCPLFYRSNENVQITLNDCYINHNLTNVFNISNYYEITSHFYFMNHFLKTGDCFNQYFPNIRKTCHCQCKFIKHFSFILIYILTFIF
jgi:hypothetical protein